MSIFEWSTTAADNATADANVNWAEGQPPSTVNNSSRAEMAAEASWLQGIGGALTTAGTGSAYTLTLADAPTAYTTSMLFLVKFHAVSAATTATINVNALGAKALKLWDGSALPSVDYIPVNAYGLIKYDGTDMRVFLPSSAADTQAENVFTADQTIQSTDAGSGEGPILTLDRNSASPAGSDVMGGIRFAGRNSLAATISYGKILTVSRVPTSGAEDSSIIFQTYEAGALGTRLDINSGLVVGAAAGGDQGLGSLNAVNLYDDGVLLTPYVLEQARDGKVDLTALDAKVPNITDANGNVVEGRRHEPARKFLDRIGTEYDPLDIDKFTQHWKDKTHLSSMVNPANAKDGKVMGIGSWIQRLIETVEIQAVHIDKLNQRVKALESA